MLVAPLLEGKEGDKAQKFIWGVLSGMCLYAARRVPEISDSIVDVDRAMRWGFGWELGPFEVWDAIGVEPMARQLEKEGQALPPLVTSVFVLRQKIVLPIGAGRNIVFRFCRQGVPAGAAGRRNHDSEIAEGARQGNREKFRRQPDRSGRRRGVLRIPRQDERHRRRSSFDDSQGSGAAARGVRRHGDCQPGARIFQPART